mmetsp:Transcript_13575/g.28464  ORF Transcript_13575/g.28464 Transcript_13575/m.28464 type:complete len:83 (+) Transcript_13575:131-379(+)
MSRGDLGRNEQGLPSLVTQFGSKGGFLDMFVLVSFEENIVSNQPTVSSSDFKQREGLPEAAGLLSSRCLSGGFWAAFYRRSQ